MKAIVILAIFFSSFAYSFQTKHYSLYQRIINSDLVIVGIIVESKYIKNDEYKEISNIEIIASSDESLKSGGIKYYHFNANSEEDTRCCTINKKYILFLKRYKDGYVSSAGSYGAYEINDEVETYLNDANRKISHDKADEYLLLHRSILAR